MWIFTLWIPLSWVSEPFRQDIGQISTLQVFFIIQNIFIMKNVTDFRETVETGVDPRLKSLSDVRSSFIL